MASRAAGAVAAPAQAPPRPSTCGGFALLVVVVLAFASTVSSSSSPLLPRPLGLGFVPSPQYQQPSSSSSSSSSCCGGRHHASSLHPHARPAEQVTKRHALPPFDSPIDPTTLESMAAAASSAARTGGAMNEVTTEQLWVGFIAGVFPFVWAGYEFWKRIDTQQRCGVCQGSGLVYESATGKSLTTPRKCYACGGFLPWAGWKRFWLSNLDIGNGGILQRPAPDYEALSEAAKKRRAGGKEGKE